MTSIQVSINNFPEGGTIRINGAAPTILPTSTPAPGTPTPTPTPTPSNYDYIITPSMGSNLNSLFSTMLKSGKKTLVKNGQYNLSKITFPSDIVLDAESHNTIINSQETTDYLINFKSNSIIRNFKFNHNKTLCMIGQGAVSNFRIENNHFVGAQMSITVKNTNTGMPTSGYGYILNNTGYNSRLGSVQGSRNNLFSGNKFTDFTGPEYFDFNGNAHYNTFENNEFVNGPGYYVTDEAIDMIGNNTNNILRNNKVVGCFQRALRPSYEANDNIIEDNYFEYIPGVTANGGGIVTWNSGAIPNKIPKRNKIRNNTIISMTSGIQLKGAQDNIVTGNNISKCLRGISCELDTYKGANAISSGNVITGNNIKDVEYGLYVVDSPNNTFSPNNITNWSKGKTFGI